MCVDKLMNRLPSGRAMVVFIQYFYTALCVKRYVFISSELTFTFFYEYPQLRARASAPGLFIHKLMPWDISLPSMESEILIWGN